MADDKKASDWKKEYTQLIIAILVTVGFFGIFIMVFFFEIPDSMRDAFMMMVGAVIGSFSTILNWYFGSSKGSSKKDETMDKLLNKGGSQ